MSTIPAGADPAALASVQSTGPRDDATTEERDEHWLKTTYQGTGVPQLTVRAVCTGALLGALLSVGNLYTVLKIGLSFGVTITACMLSFLAWGAVRAASGGRVGQLTILENNCMQSTASAAGFSTGAVLSVTFAALLMLDPEHRQQPWWVVASFTFTTAVMGVLLAIPMKRLLINHERLPFPTATATAATLRSLYASGGDAVHKAVAMVASLAAGALVGVLSTAEDQFAALGRFFAWMRERVFDIHLPGQIPEAGFAQLAGKPLLGFGFDPGVVVVGAGMIAGLRVSLSMLAASTALYVFVAPWLQGLDAAHAAQAGYVRSMPPAGGGAFYFPLRWSLWGGTSVLVFSGLMTLALRWRTVARAFSMMRGMASGAGGSSDTAIRAVEVPGSWMLAGMIPVTIAMLAIQVLAFGLSWWCGLIAIAMSFVLSLVVARAVGESDLAPEGATGKVMQLLFAAISPPGAAGAQASLNQNVLASGISANSASASSDLLSDLKTGHLLGAHPRKQFLAQFAGVIVGTLVCVPAWFLLVPDAAALDKYPAPAAHIWAATARALTGGLAQLPPSILVAILAGAVLGMLLPIAEQFLPRAKAYLPSATGLGLGWVIPFSVALSFGLGAVLAAVWRRLDRGNHERYGIPVASGLIAGDSMVHAILAMLATAIGIAGT